ncbi:MAG: proline--tRNA ligase [Betaproteobacteria bacterium]|nr:MAG: proline--tRNA ligase [Betaproteobacteria bacterium]
MRVSRLFLSTLKEAPAEAELVSHRLMLRAGLIRRLASGLYTWLPLGLRIVRKVEAVVRREMNATGAVEVLMPAIQPAELWQESGRWEQYGPDLLRLKDRHERDFCVGPTHEEVVSDLVRREVRSYRQLPVTLYQIQLKFRDEIRPRFGVMRAREFLMKDGYSFHADKAGLDQTYHDMYEAYGRIFTSLGLRFRAVAADTGAIGGTGSHEFHVLADSGEDAIAFCPKSDYAANVELAEALAPLGARPSASGPMRKIATPGKRTCEAVCEQLGCDLKRSVKAVMVHAAGKPHMLLLRGDHTLNQIKAAKLPGMERLRLASAEEVREATGCEPGFIGPVGLDKSVPVIADRTAALMADFVCGANEADHHLAGVNFGRDLPEPSVVADIRNVVAGDPSPDGAGTLEICRGIEVGHIFQLRKKYSDAMNIAFLDEAGKLQTVEMGCYGIGVTRIVAAAIEQNHDSRGIIFPPALAPFQVAIVPIGAGKNAEVRTLAERLYEELTNAGIDVLLDDRDERPGVMFADMDLIGIPYRIVIGERGLKNAEVEFKARREEKAATVAVADIVDYTRTRTGAAA